MSAHRDRIDQLLAEHAEGWTVARMPAVDRNLLRIGVFELLWVDEIDDPVAITEAVELARTLSTDDSPRFLNGVLSRIADIAPPAARHPSGSLRVRRQASSRQPYAGRASGGSTPQSMSWSVSSPGVLS